MQAEKCIADDEEEKVGFIAEEVSKKQKGGIAVSHLIPLHNIYSIYYIHNTHG